METNEEGKKEVREKEAPEVLHIEKIEHEWMLVTEALKREIFSDVDLRSALTGFSQIPISENFSQEVFSRIQNTRVQALLNRYSQSLDIFLHLPFVAEERITPDLQNAKLSEQERLIAAMRYRFARDLKTLCLAAELEDHPISVEDRGHEVLLPSGVKVMMDASYSQQGLELINPLNWEKRKQLKDRVYEVTANGHKYILKERKTPKHEHQKVGGYKETLSSMEEFAIAKELNEKGRLRYASIEVDFEKPIGYVEFPDGFEFVVFEYNSTAKSRKPEDEHYNPPEVAFALEKRLLRDRPKLESEYKEVADLAEKDFLYRQDMEYYESSITNAALLSITKVLGKRFRPVRLSFEDFVKVKALRMFSQAKDLLVASHYGLGYSNSDHDGFAYVVPEQGDAALKVVGYDFEYYKAYEQKDELKDVRTQVGSYLYGQSRWESNFGNMTSVFNRVQGAAYFALLHLEQEKLKQFADPGDLVEGEE
jgi:hypothetical protein